MHPRPYFGISPRLPQVVRYTALLSGVFYGVYHRRSLQKAHDLEKIHHAKHEQEELISKAKEAWKKKQDGAKDGGEYCSLTSISMRGSLSTRHADCVPAPLES